MTSQNEMTKKEKLMFEVLTKIASKFNSAKINWALGGSFMLYLRGARIPFHDIDLIIERKDCDEANRLLKEIGNKKEAKDGGMYTTFFFGEYVIDDCDIDLMADVSLKNSDYVFSLSKEDIDEYKIISGLSIPLHSVKKWKDLYEKIGRTEKVRIIEDLF